MSVTDDSGRVGESLEFGWQLIDPGRSVKIHAIFFSYVCPALMVKAAPQSRLYKSPLADSSFLGERKAKKQKKNNSIKNWCVRALKRAAYNPLKRSQLQKLGCGIAQPLWHRVIESWAGSCPLIGSTAPLLLCSCAPGKAVVKLSLQLRTSMYARIPQRFEFFLQICI